MRVEYTFDLARFDTQNNRLLTSLLWCGGLAAREQIVAHVGNTRRADIAIAKMIEHGLARRKSIGWKNRVFVALRTNLPERYAMFCPDKPIPPTPPKRWASTVVRNSLTRFEYLMRFRRGTRPFQGHIAEEFGRVFAPTAAEHRAAINQLKAEPRTKEVLDQLAVHTRALPNDTLLPHLQTLMPNVGLFLRFDARPEHLHVVFVDNASSPAKYRDLLQRWTKCRRQLAKFVPAELEILADSALSAQAIERVAKAIEGVSVTNLGVARYLMAPRELPQLFTAEEVQAHVAALRSRCP